MSIEKDISRYYENILSIMYNAINIAAIYNIGLWKYVLNASSMSSFLPPAILVSIMYSDHAYCEPYYKYSCCDKHRTEYKVK